jgi:protoporphyrinogen oxidase
VNLSKTLIVSITHRLGKEEAIRRIRSGLTNVPKNFSRALSVERQVWVADQLTFRVRSMGLVAEGKFDVTEDHVRLEATLSWLLGILAEKLTPIIRRPSGRSGTRPNPASLIPSVGVFCS